MVLSNEEVIALIEKGVSDKIVLARKRARKVNMHITGKNVKTFLEQLDDYETYAQKLLREKLVKSNRSLFSFILRPTDKIFTAKGGSVSYNLPQDKINFLKKNINDVADGLDIKRYLKKVVKKQYIIDPNGVLFIDIDPEGMLETHVVNSDNIFWYENKGNHVKAIIFEPYKKKFTEDERCVFESVDKDSFNRESEKLYYRVIDDSTDRIFVQDGETVVLEDSVLTNFFGFVPALILGDEKNPNEDIFESFISDIIDDADAHLREVSTSTVHNLAHLYPRYWSYAQACTRCEGEGEINTLNDEGEIIKTEVCPSCGGEGHKTRTNPSDETIVPIPQDGEHILAPHLMGFASPDLETAKFYKDMISSGKRDMFQSIWGTTYESSGKRETATGRWLDQQPVEDRLREVSETFANMHRFMLNCYGKVLLNNNRYESSVSYGTRYILESPDDILNKLIEVCSQNTPDSIKVDLMKRYLEAEYQNDSMELFKRRKLSKLEPFPSISSEKVAVMDFLDSIEKAKKLYYSQWVSNLKDEQIVILTDEELNMNFNNYINTKQLTDEGTEV
jgi:hypothetical protein